MADIRLSTIRLFVWALISAMGASALRGPLGFVPSGGNCFSHSITLQRNSCIDPILLNSGRFLSLKSTVGKPVRSMNRYSCRRKQSTMQQSPNSGNEVDEAVTYQSAIRNTGLAVSAAVAFGIGVGAVLGVPKAIEFFSGYVVEESLSVDNLFVFILLFEYFKVSQALQQRVLKWGIIGAAVLRGAFIAAGLVAIESFKGVLLVFAGFLIFSSFKILTGGEEEEEEDLSQNSVVKLASRLVQSTTEYDGDKFFTVVDGVRRATPLLLVLVCVELSDVMFAVDSIPAVFGITEDPFIVLTSNLFAILGLRALFQIISKVMKNLEYLEPAVGLVLGFVGLKMVGGFFGVEVPPAESLAVILSLLGGGVGLSYLNRHDEEESLVDPLQEAEREAEREREREAESGVGLSFKAAPEVPTPAARSPTDTK